MFLLYSEKNSARLSYIVNHIFGRILNAEIAITTDLETFKKTEKIKISYGEHAIDDELFIKRVPLLFEKKIRTQEISFSKWQNLPTFFLTDNPTIPFDIFAASFFLITRYEEYCLKNVPHFAPENSLAYQNHFLELPLIDLWANELKKILQEKQHSLLFPESQSKEILLFEIKQAFKIQAKGILRTFFRIFQYIFSFKYKKIIKLLQIFLNLRKDPYDIYNFLVKGNKRLKNLPIFFFLVGDYTIFDRNISYLNTKYQNLLRYISDHAIVSVLGSYHSVWNPSQMQQERQRMKDIIHRPIKRFRASNDAFLVPNIYRLLPEIAYNQDYSMGYNNLIGFRASTAIPFYFYDVGLEMQTPIQVIPICFHSDVVEKYSENELIASLSKIKKHLSHTGGTLAMIFSNDFIANHKKMYLKITHSIINL